MVKKLLFIVTTLTLLIESTWASESEHSDQHAHTHGLATLDLVQEANSVVIEFKSPAVNIVGFEHQAKDDEDRSKIHKAIETLKQGDKLFVFSSDAGCRLEDVNVESELSETHEGHDHESHDEEHADHDHESHDEEHAGHDEDAEEESHSDFAAIYQFHCNNPEALAKIDLGLFEHFPLIEEIQSQLVTDTLQTSVHLEAGNSRIELE